MELLLLKGFAFLRPIFELNIGPSLLGISIFDAAGILLIGTLVVALMYHMSTTKELWISSVDVLIALYVTWCILISFIYYDKTDIRELVKWVFPPFTYIVVKSTAHDKKQFLRLIYFMLFGFGIVVFTNAVAVFYELDGVLFRVPYVTKLAMYAGLYSNPGNFGLNMVLFIMLGVLYGVLCGRREGDAKADVTALKKILFIMGTIAAIYCIFKAQTRTAMLGLLVYISIYYYFKNKKMLITTILGLVVAFAIFSPILKLIFVDVVQVYEGERDIERIGSGRPYIWAHNLSEFSKMNADRIIAGAGIGNKVEVFRTNKEGGDSLWPSHNDFVGVLVHTGIVGLVLFLLLLCAILSKILQMRGSERHIMFAFYAAIIIMSFATNGFFSRFGLGQMFYLVIAYVEIKSSKFRIAHGAAGMRSL